MPSRDTVLDRTVSGTTARLNVVGFGFAHRGQGVSIGWLRRMSVITSQAG
jgi:hypothetical protein